MSNFKKQNLRQLIAIEMFEEGCAGIKNLLFTKHNTYLNKILGIANINYFKSNKQNALNKKNKNNPLNKT